MQCPECDGNMVERTDPGDPDVGYWGGEMRWECLLCGHMYDADELSSYSWWR